MINSHGTKGMENSCDEDLFKDYCQAGSNRTLKAIALSSGKSLSHIKKLSVKHHWVVRAAVIDQQRAQEGWLLHQSSNLSAKHHYTALVEAMRHKISESVEGYVVPKSVNLAQIGRALESLLRVEHLVTGANEASAEPDDDEPINIEVIGIDA